MIIFNEIARQQYMANYPIDHLFSFSITQYVEIHQFERGEWMNSEGSFPEYLYYLVEGRAKIYITEANGKVALVNFAEPNMFIGEMELLHDSYYSKGVQTTGETTCYAIPLTKYKEQLLHDVVFLRHLSVMLGRKASIMSTRFSQAQSYPLENRLAEFILLSAHDGMYKEKHTEVSDYLGVSYRHLLFVLAQFCKDGIIQKDKRSYVILDEARLREFAAPLHSSLPPFHI